MDLKLRSLKQGLEKTRPIVGHPVIITLDGMSVFADYDILNKFVHSLDKNGFWNRTFQIEGASLVIRYTKHGQSGGVELFIPAYQAELLVGLPIIDLKDAV